MVEHHLAKVRVASSNLVVRSTEALVRVGLARASLYPSLRCIQAFVVSKPRSLTTKWIEAPRTTWTNRPVGRSPYRVVYAGADDVVYILAVAHHHRRPDYWGGRLPT